MGMKILRHRWSGMAREIVWCGDRAHFGFIHDAQGGHVTLDSMTETDSRIEPAADDIGMRVVYDDFNANIRVFGKKRPKQRFESAGAKYRARRPFDRQTQTPNRF